jgi:hypothetical protein
LLPWQDPATAQNAVHRQIAAPRPLGFSNPQKRLLVYPHLRSTSVLT